MTSIPPPHTKSHPPYQDLRAQLARAQQRITFLEAENKDLRQKLHWREQLDRVSNTTLSTGERATLRVTMQHLADKEPDEHGYYHLDLWKIGKASGQSGGTVGKHLKYCAESVQLFERRETYVSDATTETGYRTEVGVKPDVARIANPLRYSATKARNHGGDRKTCPACHSQRIRKKTTYTCMDCGTIFDQNITDFKDDEEETTAAAAHPQQQGDVPNNASCDTPAPFPNTNLTSIKTKEEPGIKLISDVGEKPASPPMPSEACLIHTPALLPIQHMKEQPQEPGHTWHEQETKDRHEQTVRLLLDIAGDTSEHISMPGGPGKKYTTIHRSLTTCDIEGHLVGSKTVGATLHHIDGTTRALCFDTDDNPTDSVTWQQLRGEAALLVARGYKLLLEPSPADRGGHLWLIFSERVNARAAYHAVCEIVPTLKGIVEYWPGRGKQKVRLPAGRYVTPAVSAWTQIQDVHGNIITTCDLLDQQTPASLIPALAPDEDKPELERTRSYAEEEDHEATAPHRSRTPDEQHRTTYGNHSMWVEWPREQYIIDRFNEAHPIDELAEVERNGMVNAGQIGRPERTASVAITADGQWFTDFGTGGTRNADGRKVCGDAFEFYCRSHSMTKSAALQQFGQELNREASAEILRASRAGKLPPVWVMEIISRTGWEVYNENALRAGQKTLQALIGEGGLAGFSEAQPRQHCSEQETRQARVDEEDAQHRHAGTPGGKVEDVPEARCCAIYSLNEHGKPARAREKIVGYRECGSTRWLWSAAAQCAICAACWTPRPEGRAREE